MVRIECEHLRCVIDGEGARELAVEALEERPVLSADAARRSFRCRMVYQMNLPAS